MARADAALVFNAPDKLTLESATASEARLMKIALVKGTGVVLVYMLRKRNEVRSMSLRRASKYERSLSARWCKPAQRKPVGTDCERVKREAAKDMGIYSHPVADAGSELYNTKDASAVAA